MGILHGRRFFIAGAAAAVVLPAIAATAMTRKGVHVPSGKLAARMKNWSRDSAASLRAALDKKTPHVVKWYREIKAVKTYARSELGLLFDINVTVNSTVHYRDDWEHWHRRDYWEPVVTAILEGGDCEDYALCKAAALHLDGWPHESVRLLVGLHIAGRRKVPHAVLMAKTSTGRNYILDNLTNRIIPLENYESEFIPYYSLDETGDTIIYEAGFHQDPVHPAFGTDRPAKQ